MTIDTEQTPQQAGKGYNMTTKDEERKALEQIKKILAGLGNDSYVATAIDQMVLNMAEENIDNDWACSPSDRIESLEKAESAARIETQETAEKLERMTASRDEWQKKAERSEKSATEYKECYDKEYKRNGEIAHQCKLLEQTKAALKAEIIELKAKCYDLMTK